MHIIFDFDSTLLSCEWLDLLAAIALDWISHKGTVLRQIQDITSSWMDGEFSFSASLEQRLSLLQADRTHLHKLNDRIVKYISPSCVEQQEFFRSYWDSLFIVSWWFEEFIFPVTDFLGIDRWRIFANKFIFDWKGAIIGFDTTRDTAHDEGKVKVVSGLSLWNSVLVVWDGFTDYEIRQAGFASLFAAYTENVRREKVIEHADIVFQDMHDVVSFVSSHN